jgi:wyosine [tRNA(Phe)-imidazoG37] synthetase (radical SAM superfamily)
MSQSQEPRPPADGVSSAWSDLVYPVYSRRAGGLSVGINLFPEGKLCSFDCPYCEVFPFPPGPPFSVERLDAELGEFFKVRRHAEFPGTPIMDICVSGRGEPSLSPFLEQALYAAASARKRWCPEAKLVLITNSSGFVSGKVLDILDRFANKNPLSVWAKLDGGTEAWYAIMGRSGIPFKDILLGIERYAMRHPLAIQTMICSVDGRIPDVGQIVAYASRLQAMLDRGADLEEVQLYTQARPSPEGRTAAVDDSVLYEIAQRIRETTQGRIKVRTFGASG